MSFANPWMLWGLGLAAVPILIHLLHKRRYRESAWAAIRFLQAAVRKQSRRMRLESLLLLAMRVLAMLLLAMGLAEPVGRGLARLPTGSAPRHTLLIVDHSLSMGTKSAGETRLDSARKMVRQLVSDALPGDSFQIVRIGSAGPLGVITIPARDTSEVLNIIDSFPQSEEFGNVGEALATAESLLSEIPESAGRPLIVCLSDFQRENWAPKLETEKSAIGSRLASLSERGELHLVDVSQGNVENVTVAEFRQAGGLSIAQGTSRLQGIVHNDSSGELTGRRVELVRDGTVVDLKTVDLPPRSDVTVEFEPTTTDAGDVPYQLRVDDDPLPADNLRAALVSVTDEIPILIVSGVSDGTRRPASYLRTALSPLPESAASPRGLPSLIRLTMIDEGALEATELAQYAIIFLVDVGLFSPVEAQHLKDFVAAGGGLVFALGPQSDPGNYNSILGKAGVDLLPGTIGELVGSPENYDRSFTFDPGDYQHPIVREFQGNPQSGLLTTPTFVYRKLSAPADADTLVPLKFDSGDPAILDRRVDRGRSLVTATTLDERWTTWPLSPSFLPIQHELVSYLLESRQQHRQFLVGAPIEFRLPRRVETGSAIMTVPGGTSVNVPLADTAVRFLDTTQSGLYELALTAPLNRTERFVVNPDPREGRLDSLDERSLRTELLGGAEVRFSRDWNSPRRQRGDTGAPQSPYARLVLLTAFIVLLVEQLMAWRFVYGLIALALALWAALAIISGNYSPLLGSLLAAVGIALAGLMIWKNRARWFGSV